MTRACAVMVVMLWSVQAVAQDDFDFGEEEVQAVDAESPAAEFMTEGKALYKKGDYVQASLLFFKALEQEDVGSEAFKPEAQYELSKALLRLELYQGALEYLGRIVDEGETHPYYLPALNGLLLLSEVIPSDQTLLERMTPYAPNYPDDVLKKFRPQFAYLVGRSLYSSGQYDEALRLLKDIKRGNEFYLRAQYIAGVTHVASYEAKPALESFRAILRVLVPKLEEEGELNTEEAALLEQTYIAMARVFYSTGSYNKSVKYYNRIPRTSPLWPKVLFELSWAYFQLDLINKSLGNLHTLNSPFFANEFHPEAPILAAVIFFYNCKYPRVRYELEEFEYSYMPIVEDLKEVKAQYEDDTALYEWLGQLRSGETELDEEFTRLLGATLDDKQVERKLNLIASIEQEAGKLGKMDGTWLGSPLGVSLQQDNQLALELAKSDAGSLVRARLDRVQREIELENIDREKIIFEVARAERGEIDRDLDAEMIVSRNETDAGRVDVSDEELYWTFNGEYWKDELGFYFFTVNSECKR